jgi:hypothetical protein
MELPSLSVVIPNFNHAQYLPRCLDALLAQSVQPREILVIDDCSTDDSVKLIEGYATKHPHVRLIRNEKNLGVIPNLNHGLRLASSDYVYFAAADDFVLPGFVEKSLRLLASHPQAGLSCTIGDWREPSTGLNPHIGAGMGERPCHLDPSSLADLEHRSRLHIASNTVIYRKAELQRIGGFRPELKWHTDWFAMYVLAFRFGICFVPEPLAVFFLHPAGYSANTPDKRQARREVYRALLAALAAPEMDDVRPALQETGALFVFGTEMLDVIRGDASCRGFLTPPYVRKARWQGFKLAVKRFTPAWLGEIYYRLSGARAKKSAG